MRRRQVDGVEKNLVRAKDYRATLDLYVDAYGDASGQPVLSFDLGWGPWGFRFDNVLLDHG